MIYDSVVNNFFFFFDIQICFPANAYSDIAFPFLGLTALTLQPSANPVAVGTNVTISVNNPPIISSGTWLFGQGVVFLWSGGLIFDGSSYLYGITFNSSSYAITISNVNLNSSGLYALESMGSNKGRGDVTLEVQGELSLLSYINTYYHTLSVKNIVKKNITIYV